MRFFSFRFNCLTLNLARRNWSREWGDLSVSLTVVCSPSAWRVPCPFFKTVFGVHLPRGEYTLSIFKRKWDVVNVFRNLLSHTRKRDKKEIAVQCKVLTNWVLRCNTPVLIKMRPIQTWHFICAHFYADGETLVFSLEKPTWKVKNRNLF